MAEKLRLGDDQWLTSKAGTPLTYTNDIGGIEGHLLRSFRSSSKTCYGRDGYMYDVPVDEPAICFKKDPRGALMMEPEQENTVQHSNRLDFSSGGYNAGGWSVNNLNTRTPDAVISPRGTQDAVLMKGSVSSSGVYTNAGAVTSGLTYSALIHLKFIDGDGRIKINFEQGFSEAVVYIHSDGSYDDSRMDGVDRIEVTALQHNGWYEVKIHGLLATSSTGAGVLSIYKDNPTSLESFSAWGVNRVRSIEVHSHIETDGAPVTRAADGNYRAVEMAHIADSTLGAVEMEYLPSLETAGNSRVTVGDGAGLNRLYLQEKDVFGNLGGNFGFITSVNTGFSGNFIVTSRDTQKVAVSYGQGPELVVNGVSELRRDDLRHLDADKFKRTNLDDFNGAGNRKFRGGLVSYRIYDDMQDVVNVKSTRDEILTDSKYNIQ